MKILDERNTQKNKTKKKKQTKTEKSKGVTEAILQGWELIDFIVHLS